MATINGTAGNDNLYGTSGNDVITGLDGNDYLYSIFKFLEGFAPLKLAEKYN